MDEQRTAVSSETVKNIYNKEFMPGIYRWGMFTDILGAALSWAPIFVLSFIFGISDWKAMRDLRRQKVWKFLLCRGWHFPLNRVFIFRDVSECGLRIKL